MDRIFFDSDIILDLILGREPFFGNATDIFTLVEENNLRGYTSPLIFSNLFYILRKYKSAKIARQLLVRLKALLHLVPVDERIIDLALHSEFRDFEDAIQYYAALESGIDYLITRNKKDYRETGCIICTPKEFLAMRKGM